MLASSLATALDPALFAVERLGLDPDPWQERVLRSTAPRLLLNCSRQSGKSTVAAVRGVHRAVYVPRSLVLLVSPSLRQSGELFRKAREMIRTLELKPREDSAASFTLANGSRVVSLPGTEATVRAFSGVNLIIEDEASRVSDELHAALRPMLATSNGTLILASTPHGARGHFYEAWTSGGSTWHRERITADDCPRITPEFLAEERSALGEWLYRQEYFCEFVDAESQLFMTADVLAALDPNVRPLWSS